MSTDKPWDRPWSMDEIIANSDNWSIAGDVALLNTLKAFADNLMTKTTEINNNLQNLTNQLDETSLQLNISQNEFQSLRNSQFIESRVYEDDETLPQLANNSKPEEVEPDRTEDIKQAAFKGLQVLDRYFDKIEVSVSDSEDDDIDLPNYVLRPKDLYMDRALPYVIGSEEWHKSWHVGLEDSSSDSETEKVSDKFSESDSESDLPIIQDRSQIKGTSDTSSELDFSQKTEPRKKPDLFESSDSEDLNSIPVQVPISNQNFAEQLAAKLGHVINSEFVEEINRRPIQVKPQYGDLFFDEPPPLDNNKGIFSGGGGLFDDDDLESKVAESPKTHDKPGAGLFDEDSSDDDIFNTKKPILQTNKPPLLVEEPPELDNKKPVGGRSMFGGGNLFDKKLLRQPSSDDGSGEKPVKKIDLFDDGDLFKTAPPEKTITKSETLAKKINLFDSDEEDKTTKSGLFEQNKSQEHKKLLDDNKDLTSDDKKTSAAKNTSLFDSDDDLFKDDLFSTNTKKKFTSGLFDDIDDQSDELFGDKIADKPKPTRNLFADLIAVSDNENSINVDTKTEIKEKVDVLENVTKAVNNLFGSSPKTSDSLFGDLDDGKTFAEEREAPKSRPKMSLFDSPSPEPDDLFGDEIFTKKESTPKDTINIFDSSSTSDDLFGENPYQDTFNNQPSKATSLFSSPTPEPNEDIFAETKTLMDNTPKKSTLFSSPTLNTDDDIFADTKTVIETSSTPEINEDIFAQPETTPKKPPLFSSSTPETDNKPVKISPNLRLFDPSPPPDDDWETKSEHASDENDSYTDQEDLVSQKPNLFNEEPPSLGVIPIQSVSNITEKFEKEEPVITKPNPLSPGKLKHNLNINVVALMPGSAPPKRGDLHRSTSLEQTDETDRRTTLDSSDSVEVLHSVTKDRARVPLKRRPSTRRGRKAALRNSGIDFKLEQEKESVSDSKIESAPSADLFESAKPPKQEAPPKADLFDDDDDDMFSSKKVPVQTAKISKNSLFDDDDNDDDLFSFSSGSAAKRPETRLAAEKKIPKISGVKKLENTKPDDDPLSALMK